ncbi:hypothetical protein H2200_009824 [Cladophialophora chaetospira]|uniref:Actin-like ATPase domain-containing protein n=1 Tax=Cladophialophora chaetospira TaxID=386627 RepID=A0AA39CEX3_9EURO|nr:hypothetical protein H2200_009824 [Cladophialophora chaetospira]
MPKRTRPDKVRQPPRRAKKRYVPPKAQPWDETESEAEWTQDSASEPEEGPGEDSTPESGDESVSKVGQTTTSESSSTEHSLSKPKTKPDESDPFLWKLIASLDLGTKFSKAAFTVVPGTTPASNHASRAGPDTLIWDNGSEYDKTQFSYTKAPDSDTWTFRCGYEVDRAEQTGIIHVEDIIPGLKPAVFGEAGGLSDQTREKISRLPETPEDGDLVQQLKTCGQDGKAFESVGIGYFVMLARERWWFMLQRIAEDKKDIGVPYYEYISQYKGWKPPPTLKIEVAIPLPAKLDVIQTQRILGSLMAAGIPNPYPWPESMCIVEYQLRREPPESIHGKVVLVIDAGAASGSMRTEWVGGSFLNAKFMEWLLENTELESIFKVHSVCLKSWQKLLHDIEQEFEKGKQSFRFRDSENLILRVPGLPHIPDSMICEKGKIIVTQDQLKNIWAPSTKRMCESAEDTIKEAGKVDQIILCGGSSRNEYLRKVIREHFHHYEVRFPQKQAAGSIPVAMGAVELSQDKQIITKRNIAYGFCIGWWQHWDDFPDGTFPDECKLVNEWDSIARVFITHFFFLPCSSVDMKCEFRVRGWRQLPLGQAAMDSDASGRLCWPIEEELFYCTGKLDTDKPIEEVALAIEAANNKIDILAMPKPLKFSIDYEEACGRWARTRTRNNKEKNKAWLDIEYEIILQLDGECMTFEILIPAEGHFRGQNRDPSKDMHIPVDYNIAALFQHIQTE